MSTIKQSLRNSKIQKKKKCRTKALQNKPQIKGTVLKVTERTPRKPNSARRKIARIRTSAGKEVDCYLKGERSIHIQKFSQILIEGHGPKDLPGINYRAIRGKFDFGPVIYRSTARSKYGKKRFYT